MEALPLASAVISPAAGEPEPAVSPGEFFDPEFMARYSRFSSFEEFSEESPWTITEWQDIDSIDMEELDGFIDRTTEFDSWDQLRNRAATRELRDRLLV